MIHSGFRELLDEFLLEAQERANEVESLLLQLNSGDAEARAEALARAKRELHTLKGNSGMMGLSDLQQLTHQMEDAIESLDLDEPVVDDILGELDLLRRGLEEVSRTADEDEDAARTPADPMSAASAAAPATLAGETADRPAGGDGTAPDDPASSARAGFDPDPQAAGLLPADTAASSVRVPFSRIDLLVEMQAESLIFRNRLKNAIERGKALTAKDGRWSPEQLTELSTAAWEDVEGAQQSLEKVLVELQEQITELSMVPMLGLFRSLRRIVHDESLRESKTVEMIIQGGETPIDKTLLEAAGDALGHLVRNAVIHGIEAPAERRRQNKPESGRIRVGATVDANEIRIEVADDGAGIDVEALREIAKRRLDRRVEFESDLALLFEEGVSTRQTADVSAGRGVGLSVVKKSVEQHGGRIAVESRRGVGTSFVLRLPVIASILRSLTLRADGEEYALPLTAVAETLQPRRQDRHEINHAGVVRWRGRVVPLLDLGCTFGTAETPRTKGFVIVMEINGRFRALAADEIIGIHDIVVKGLDPVVGTPAGISGSTILGDGRVIMILNPTALASIPPFPTQ